MTAMVLQDQNPEDGRQITVRQLAVIVAVAAVLSVAREVFIPLAIAMLITFALSPAVTALRKRTCREIDDACIRRRSRGHLYLDRGTANHPVAPGRPHAVIAGMEQLCAGQGEGDVRRTGDVHAIELPLK